MISREEAQKRLMLGALQYFLHAKFSRVAGLVYEAVTASVKGGEAQREYLVGYLEATLQAVERLAPVSEAETMSLVLHAAKGLLDPRTNPIETGVSIALISMERLAA